MNITRRNLTRKTTPPEVGPDAETTRPSPKVGFTIIAHKSAPLTHSTKENAI